MKKKRCGTCEKVKPVSDFHRNKARDDGYHSRCKACRSLDAKEEYATNPDEAKGRINTWRQGNPDKRKASDKTWVQNNREKVYETVLRWVKSNPEKRRAHEFVKNAIRNGKLPPVKTLACSFCPKQASHYHHYKGYDKEHWLDVVPVCSECHNKIHHPKPVPRPG